MIQKVVSNDFADRKQLGTKENNQENNEINFLA